MKIKRLTAISFNLIWALPHCSIYSWAYFSFYAILFSFDNVLAKSFIKWSQKIERKMYENELNDWCKQKNSKLWKKKSETFEIQDSRIFSINFSNLIHEPKIVNLKSTRVECHTLTKINTLFGPFFSGGKRCRMKSVLVHAHCSPSHSECVCA